MDLSQIKLLIWDLDETLWKGTLSEGKIYLPDENKQLIIDAVNAGVMCSICSKNDASQVESKLQSEGLADFFVFSSVNWSPKGERIREIISAMNLRAVNVMFIDDNPSNRGEASACCPGLTAEDITIIPALSAFFALRNTIDLKHERLERYRLLEKKRQFQAQVGSNLDFLRQSNIQVKVFTNCSDNLARIFDLISRSNQLNFTKVRSSEDELVQLFKDPAAECAYVTASDNFGEYGIIGFYARKNGKLLHFTFSCRVLGMGIEQYIYRSLGCPELSVVGDVSSNLYSPEVDWINLAADSKKQQKAVLSAQKILLKGPCDLEQIFAYIDPGQNIITEFVYVNDKGIRISQGTHTMHVVQSRRISDLDKARLAQELVFGDDGMFETQMFDDDIDYIVFSLFADPSFGLYKERATGIIVAYGEHSNDMTDKSRWDQYINGEVFLSNCTFTREDLEWFSEKYEYIGQMTPESIIQNLEEMYQNINPSAFLILVLGSETEYLNNSQPAYENRHEYHRQLNAAVRDWQAKKERVRLLDVNAFISGQSDFTNNINHFTRSVYYKMSSELVSIIESCGGGRIKKKSAYTLNWERIVSGAKQLIRLAKKILR